MLLVVLWIVAYIKIESNLRVRVSCHRRRVASVSRLVPEWPWFLRATYNASSSSPSSRAGSFQLTSRKLYGSNLSKPSKVLYSISSFIEDNRLNAIVTPATDDTFQTNTNSADGWSDFLATLNKSLDPLDLEFSRMHDEITRKETYALVSNCSAAVPIDCKHPLPGQSQRRRGCSYRE